MKDPLLLLVVALVGIFLYFVAVKGVIYPFLFVLMFIAVAVWYFASFYISKKMVAKSRGEEDFFYAKAQMVNEKGTELINGALAVTSSEIVFYKRKGYGGGVQVVWSCFVSRLESYTMDKVDDKHRGLELKLVKDKNPVKFCSEKIKDQEKEFRKALGWPEE